MRKIPDAHCRFQHLVAELEMSLCTKFQLDSSYSYDVTVPKVVFYLFALSNPKLTTPKLIGILCDPRQVSVPSFKLMALKLFELCSGNPV